MMPGDLNASDLLFKTGRSGVGRLVDWLLANGFFECPASAKYHGAYPGGLVDHCLSVYSHLNYLDMRYNRGGIPFESIVICALLHDVCKLGAYHGEEAPYSYSKEHPDGHAELSIRCIEGFIELTDLEKSMIRYHMGVYGCREFSERRGEYSILDLTGAIECIPVKLMHIADQLATLDEQLRERVPDFAAQEREEVKADQVKDWFSGNGEQPSYPKNTEARS